MPDVTRAQMAVILREVAPRANGYLRGVWLDIADKIERGVGVSRALTNKAGPLGEVIRGVLDREPGEEG